MAAFRSKSHHIGSLLLGLLLAVSIEVEAQVASDASPNAATSTANAQPADNSTDAAPPSTPAAGTQAATAPTPPARRLEVYGYLMTDFGYNIETINPDWFDVMRPTKLPSFRDEFGRDGRTFAGVRQTRFGVKGFEPTKFGELKTTFEWELFAVGVDTGQTTFRLRHAYGELGHFGAGQTWSPFMDIDVFPNSIEYWGPNGHGILPERASTLDANPGRYAAHVRARETGFKSGSGKAGRSSRNCKHSCSLLVSGFVR